ncbi:hypothetical protein RUND412_004592 [Rhizina undulata]
MPKRKKLSNPSEATTRKSALGGTSRQNSVRKNPLLSVALAETSEFNTTELAARVPEGYPDEYLTENDVDKGPLSGFKVGNGLYVPIETGSMTRTIAPTPAPNKSFRLKKDLSRLGQNSDKTILSWFLRVTMWKRRNMSPEDRHEFIRIGTAGGLKTIFPSATLLNMQERVRQNYNYIMELLGDQFTAVAKQILEDKLTLKEFYMR